MTDFADLPAASTLTGAEILAAKQGSGGVKVTTGSFVILGYGSQQHVLGHWIVGKNNTNNANAGFYISPTGQMRVSVAGASADTTVAFYRNASATPVGSISTTSTSTAYNTSSDERLKTNIAPAGDAGPVIDAIQVRAFDWLSTGEHTAFGFVAQELVQIAPEAVHVGDDGAEIEEAWGVDPSKLVPLLVREIQSLRARVAALEAGL